MYSRLPAFVLGFHGCDKSTRDHVILEGGELSFSTNPYDWLGYGTYFWEQNPQRAYEYACYLRDHPHRAQQPIERPAVLGAIIDLGNCLNLLDSKYIGMVKAAYETYIQSTPESDRAENKGGSDMLRRYLDCAVIQTLHESIGNMRGPIDQFDTVRGLFREGEPIYGNSGFYEKSHIQVCVRNLHCIKGYFDPRDADVSGVIKNLKR